MSDPQRIDTVLTAALAPCPRCGAAPLQPCHTGTRTLRYTHTERTTR